MLRAYARTAVGAVAPALVSVGYLTAQTDEQPEGAAHSLRIVVPEAKGASVVADGIFSPGGWDGAFQHRVTESCEVYIMLDATHLFVGFKFQSDVEADFVSEVYFALNGREFLNLHSSGALGEGGNLFSPDSRGPEYSIGIYEGWDSNVTAIGTRGQGKEFRVRRDKLPVTTVKMAGGMTVVNRAIRETARFPLNYGFENADRWVELVLPAFRDLS